jgi:hypothetical protein
MDAWMYAGSRTADLSAKQVWSKVQLLFFFEGGLPPEEGDPLESLKGPKGKGDPLRMEPPWGEHLLP